MISKEIIENKNGYIAQFDIYETIDNHKTLIKSIRYQIHSQKIEDKIYFILYDSNMNIVERVFKFINTSVKNSYKSYNTKIQYLSSLELLYGFCDIFDLKINEMTSNDVLKFENFLLGKDDTYSKDLKLYIKKKRTQATVKKHIYNCKTFVKQQRWKNAELFTISKVTKSAVKKYGKELPAFVSSTQFEDMVNCIYENEEYSDIYKLKLECILRLMFENGLRIGEVLGLTLEDIIKPSQETYKACIIVIRNRCSDNKYQKAKTCMNVTSKNDYFLPDYANTESYGYQTVINNEQMYEDIMDYIELSEKYFKKKKLKIRAAADSVTNKVKNNRYIFLNERTPTPLSYIQINKEVRKLFVSCGLEVDKISRRNNVSHRLRHGFVMNLLYEKKIPAEAVAKLSRHSSTKSLEAYNNPTKEQKIRMMNELNDKNKF